MLRKTEKGFTLGGLLIVLFVMFVVVVVVVVAVVIGISHLVGKGIDKGDASINRQDYILQAQSIADDLGDPNREGYADDNWDDKDKAELFRALNLPVNTPSLEGVSSARIKEFVVLHQESNQTSEEK